MGQVRFLLIAGLLFVKDSLYANGMCPPSYYEIKLSEDITCIRFFRKSESWQDAFNSCERPFASILQFARGNIKEYLYTLKQDLTTGSSHVFISVRGLLVAQWVVSSPQEDIRSLDPSGPSGLSWEHLESQILNYCAAFNLTSGLMGIQNNVVSICHIKSLGKADGSSVTRKCVCYFDCDDFWDPVIESCNKIVSNTTKSLFKLSQEIVVNATKTAIELCHLTESADELKPIDVTYIDITVQKIAAADDLTTEVFFHVAKTVDHLMNGTEIEQESAEKPFSRIPKSLEIMLKKADLGAVQSFNLSLPSLYVETHILNSDAVEGKLLIGLELVREDDFNNRQVCRILESTEFNYNKAEAAFILPHQFVRNRMKHADVSKSSRLNFIVYKNSLLFTGAQRKRKKIITRVVSASLSGPPAVNLDHPVQLIFRLMQPVQSQDNISCVYWDERLASGHADWSDSGCWQNTSSNNYIVCHCDHLTNFAVLMDSYRQDERIVGNHKFALDVISYVGCALSITGLCLTIIMFLSFEKRRKNNTSKVLCNLAVSLLCLFVTFLAGIRQTEYPGLCIAVAALLHYFMLTSFCWMLIEALHQYLNFVRVLDTYIPRFVLRAMLFAWGAPLIFVIIILAVDVNMYLGGDYYCWMSLDAIYYTCLLPVGIIVSINAIVYLLVLKSIMCKRQKSLRSNQSERKQTMVQLQASACIFVLLGLTWICGFLAISSARITFQYLFCIFNSLQGFFIFLFMLLKEKSLKELFTSFFVRKQVERGEFPKLAHTKKQSNLKETSFSGNCYKSGKNKNSIHEEHFPADCFSRTPDNEQTNTGS